MTGAEIAKIAEVRSLLARARTILASMNPENAPGAYEIFRDIENDVCSALDGTDEILDE